MLPFILMFLLSLLTLHTSNGQHLSEEPCTVQILVPGLKGKLVNKRPHTLIKQKSSCFLTLCLSSSFKRRTRRVRTERSTRETRKSWTARRNWYRFFAPYLIFNNNKLQYEE